MKKVGDCATTNFDTSSPAECWNKCTLNVVNGINFNVNWTGIVWRENECGCVHNDNLGTCDIGTEKDYEYYVADPLECIPGNQNTKEWTALEISIF